MNQTAAVNSPLPSDAPTLSRKLVALHLYPGIPGALFYTVLAAVLVPRGWSQMLILMLSILLIEVPVCWVVMIRQVRRETGGRFTLADAFPWMAKIPWWQYVAIGLPLVVISMALMLGLRPVVEGALLEGLFAWVPEWFAMRPDPTSFSSMSREVLIAMWLLALVGMTIAGGVTQELYFRGFLLPRMTHLGRLAPLLNAGLFAVFHFIAPWGWPVFFLVALIWAYAVWWKRSVKIGLVGHVGMLAIQWLFMTLIGFGVLPMPGG